MSVKLLTEQHLEFLSFTGGCTGSSESKFVKMPHCCKSQVAFSTLTHALPRSWCWKVSSSLRFHGRRALTLICRMEFSTSYQLEELISNFGGAFYSFSILFHPDWIFCMRISVALIRRTSCLYPIEITYGLYGSRNACTLLALLVCAYFSPNELQEILPEVGHKFKPIRSFDYL